MRPRAIGAGRGALLLAASVSALAGCLGPGDFRCGDARTCGVNGFCETDGRCSLPVTDGSCASGRRYVHNAGAASESCVPASCPQNRIDALVTGGAHACLIRDDGALWCWGRNDDGQLGDGSYTPRSLPVRIAGLVAVAVATGQRHTCAARADHLVVCWGADDTGQLGDGGGSDQDTPVIVAGVTGAVSVAAGADFSCAVLEDGTVRCWGDDSVGQLGDGQAAARDRLPGPVVGLDNVGALSGFSQHACAVRNNGVLLCWGANAQGQLGVGSIVNQNRPVMVPLLTAVAAVGTGFSHTCAIAAGGLFCWGSNAFGQLGNGNAAAAPVTSPAAVPGVTDPIALAVGAQHTCAIQQGGTVLCWGQNGGGQLGQGPIPVLLTPVPVPLPAPATAIAAGATFSCAETKNDGAVFCWGDNHYGELGSGSGTIRTRPSAVVGVSDVVMVTSGAAHSCVATTAGGGHPVCWGADQAGQLGDGDTADRAREEPIKGELNAHAVAGGGAHTCAVTAAPAPTLWCWGRGNAGQLGLGPQRLFDARQPQQVPIPVVGAAEAVAAGATHTCTIVGTTVLCFGANGNGQLGDGTTVDRATPVSARIGAATAPGIPTAIAAGDAHTCALDDGDIWCWGRGNEGQIGSGTLADAAIPLAISLGAGGTATAIAAGAAHTCAIDDTGAVWCWGRNDEGQLGDGAPGTDRPAPVRVVFDQPALSISAGGDHTCTVLRDHTARCWGANDSGQLGDGTTTSRATPIKVDDLSDASAIAAGSAHTCALRNDETVVCWGANTSGQLGDGIALSTIAPQLARVACD